MVVVVPQKVNENVKELSNVESAAPSGLAEMWKWRAEQDPAAPQHNAPNRRRPVSSPVGGSSKRERDIIHIMYINSFFSLR